MVEDDLAHLSNCIAEIEKEYVVDIAYTASDGCYLSEVNDYDTIVVDSALPLKGGLNFCKTVRDANIASPIVYLSDVTDAEARTKFLKDGANVCLSKKASTLELKAQIKALTNLRYSFSGSKTVLLQNGSFKVNLDKQCVLKEDKEIFFRKKEFSILEHLVINIGKVVSKEELLEHIWEEGILVKSNIVEVHIRNIRAKLDATVIKTVRGFGYRVG